MSDRKRCHNCGNALVVGYGSAGPATCECSVTGLRTRFFDTCPSHVPGEPFEVAVREYELRICDGLESGFENDR